MPAKKKSVKRKTTKKRTPKTESEKNIEKVLVENFVSLQKVMTDLSGKFDKLTNQISDLLEIFETSAEALSKKDFKQQDNTGSQEEILTGLKELSEQNKIIAKGLTLVHENVGPLGETSEFEDLEEPFPEPMPPPIKTPLKRRPSQELDEYEKTISSKLKKLKS